MSTIHIEMTQYAAISDIDLLSFSLSLSTIYIEMTQYAAMSDIDLRSLSLAIYIYIYTLFLPLSQRKQFSLLLSLYILVHSLMEKTGTVKAVVFLPAV